MDFDFLGETFMRLLSGIPLTLELAFSSVGLGIVLAVALGVRKDDGDLKALLNEAVKSAIADGTVKAMSMKWFKIDMTPKS